MRDFLALLTCVAVLAGTGCSTAVRSAVLSKEASSYIVGSRTGIPTDLFSTTDERIVLRVQLGLNLGTFYRIYRIEWIQPDGSVFLDEPIENVLGNSTIIIASLPVASNQPSRLPGQWKVRLYYKEKRLTERTFTIEERGPRRPV